MSAYKRAQQLYKRKGNGGDLKGVVDFSKADDDRISIISSEDYRGHLLTLKSHPGFVYAPRALSQQAQYELAYQALTKYCEPPHATNLGEKESKEPTFWENFSTERSKDHCHRVKKKSKKDLHNQTIADRKRSFHNLSWATMGYQYDWTCRTYREECKSQMPIELEALGQIFSKLDNSYRKTIHQFGETMNDSKSCDDQWFKTSAAIVNYYSTKSMMGGHRDDLEYDFTKPVISIR